ncbi:hypothetical protein L218DRAFT_959809 [Marasmius fiardii PR-910]|nr:hypothetical protein L218DRAFT_959809 [Marasmius fiardii PR-910]
MSDITYHLRQIPSSPPTAADVQKYRAFRLLSLKTDPSAFSSTYERESEFTDKQWFDRLNLKTKVTIVAAFEGEDDEEWGGMITVLSPEFVDLTDYIPSKLRETRGVESVYVIVGMWVHPEHRRQGVGGRLIEQAFHWVRDRDGDSDKETETLLLEVERSNEDAARLYRRMRFEEVARAGSSSGEDSLFMYLDVNRSNKVKI